MHVIKLGRRFIYLQHEGQSVVKMATTNDEFSFFMFGTIKSITLFLQQHSDFNSMNCAIAVKKIIQKISPIQNLL